MNSPTSITIYTDGAAAGNPGPGGYGIVMISGKHQKEFSAGFRKTTNNRMELMAVVEALKKLKWPGMNVTIYSDSKYVVDSVEKKWVFGWQQKGFKNKKNPDLWQQFLDEYPKQNIKFVWVKGHAGNPYNERCDVLAVEASKSPNLAIDTFYEQQNG